MSRQLIINFWYDPESIEPGSSATGLFLKLEDGTILRHQSTDPIMPFEPIANLNPKNKEDK